MNPSNRISEDEVDRLYAYLKDKSISSDPEKYSALLSGVRGHPLEIDILKMMFLNVDNSTIFLGMASGFFTSADKEKEENGTATLAYLKFCRSLCNELHGEYDFLCKIIFAYLEKTRLRYIEVKNEVFSILEEIVQKDICIMSHAVSFLLTEQPVSFLSEILIFLGEKTLTISLEYILEEGEKSKNTTLHKNVGALLISIAEKVDTMQAIVLLGLYIRSLQIEVPIIRSSAIESIESLAKCLKKEIESTRKGEKELYAVTNAIKARLYDINPFCRAKAVQTLHNMAEKDTILRSIKQSVFDDVLERVKDKTHIVRKKALLFLKHSLEMHPFVLDGGMLTPAVIGKYKSQDTEYHVDCVNFYNSLQKSVEYIKEVLSTGSKGEITEIIQYTTSCVYYGIESALEIFPSLFALSWYRVSTETKYTIDILSEEIKRMAGGDPKKLVDMMIHLDDNTISYDGIIRELTFRGILGANVIRYILHVLDKAKNEETLLSHLKLFRKITTTDRSSAEMALKKILNVMGSTEDSAIQKEATSIIGNLDYRVQNKSEIIISLLEMLKKVNANNLALLEAIIDAGYLISTNPDSLAVLILKHLVENNSCFSVLFAVGHIAIKHAVHLERLETAWNIRGKKSAIDTNKRQKRESLANTEIRERRLSVGSRRNSTKITTEEQEEMADKVFFAKEHEILFGEGSALRPFVDLVESSVKSQCARVQVAALVSLGKMMLISSEYNQRSMHMVIDAITNGNIEMKVVAMIIFADSVMAFSSLVGNVEKYLFLPLEREEDTDVRITAIILIRHLFRMGMIKVKGKHWKLSLFLLETGEIQSVTQKLFDEMMKKEAPLKVFCEVIKSYAGSISAEKGSISSEKDTQKEKENTEENEQNEQKLCAVIKVLIKIKSVTDIAKKIDDWSQQKKDPVLIKACSVVLIALSTAQKLAETENLQ